MALPIPALTAEQMGRVDRFMVRELGLPTVQVMELAGWAVATFARNRFLAGDPRRQRVLILVGKRGNGGDGFVAARLLQSWGATVSVLLSHPLDDLSEVAAHQARILHAVELPPRLVSERDLPLAEADLVIDALLGFGVTRPPAGGSAQLIEAINATTTPVLAVDLPSGLDATTGEPFFPCVRADATLTLALPKTGLLVPQAREQVGDLFVADIGVPAAAYRRIGLTVGPIFATEPILPIPLRGR